MFTLRTLVLGNSGADDARARDVRTHEQPARSSLLRRLHKQTNQMVVSQFENFGISRSSAVHGGVNEFLESRLACFSQATCKVFGAEPQSAGRPVRSSGGVAMFGKQLAPVRSIAAFFALTTIFAMIVLTRSGQAQTFTVLHAFTGGGDGGNPYAGVTLDGAGNLYGTTTTNSVYKLTHRSGGWTFARLYNSGSYGGLTIGPNGTFYGINASSAVFNLQPPPHFVPNLFAPWIETTLYSLPAGSYAGVVFDRAGNIYGTTYDGGTYGLGTVFELSPSNGGWTETVLHTFGNGFDGQFPYAGLVVDDAGNLYGTTIFGGAYGNGTVFELSPSAGGWTESFIYSFTGGADGANPYGGLIFDSSGNLYGATPGPFGQGASTRFQADAFRWHMGVFSGLQRRRRGLLWDARHTRHGWGG